MKYTKTLLSMLLVIGLVSAGTASNITLMSQTVAKGLCQFKILVVGILPALALILFLFAGLAYAAGQAFGAETKAKAQGWAMSLLVGGIIGIVLAAIAPVIATIFVGMATGTGMSPTSMC
jgi:hypothetical protein